MKILKIVAVLFAMVICGCANKKCNYATIQGTATEINVSASLNSHTLQLGDAIEKIDFIYLDAKDQSVLSNIKEIISTDQYIYIIDYYQNCSLAIFDTEGKFIMRVPSGNGPEELASPQCMCFDDESKTLYVYDYSNNKIVLFSQTGDYISHINTGLHFDSFAIHDGKFYISNTIDMEHRVLEINSLFDSVEREWNLGPEKFIISASSYFQKAGDSLIVKKLYCDTIFSLKNSTLSAKYFLKNETLTVNPECVQSICYDNYFENLPKGNYIYSGLMDETNNIQCFIFETRDFAQQKIFRNKKSGQILSEKFVPNSLLNLIGYFGVCDYSSNTFVGQILPEWITNSLDLDPDYRWDGTNPSNLISPEDMEKLKSVKPDDNPIIVLFKLKSEI